MAVVEPYPFTVTTSRSLGRVIVSLEGELDVATRPSLRSTLRDVIEDQGHLDVILDLARLDFIDSSGLSVLIESNRMLRERGGTLIVSAARPRVRKVFELMGLTQVLTLADT